MTLGHSEVDPGNTGGETCSWVGPSLSLHRTGQPQTEPAFPLETHPEVLPSPGPCLATQAAILPHAHAYACTHVHSHKHTHTTAHIYTHAASHTKSGKHTPCTPHIPHMCKREHGHVCTRTSAQTHKHICSNTCTHMLTPVCVHAPAPMNTCIHVCTHTHTHTLLRQGGLPALLLSRLLH